jgi:hypothetical protein
MKKQHWFHALAGVTLILLGVFSLPQMAEARQLLSETFSNWIKIEGSSPMIYQETTSSSGGAVGMTYYTGYDDTTDFSAGVKFESGVGEHYSVRAGAYNGYLGIYVDTGGDVGVGKVPDAGYKMDVSGNSKVAHLTVDATSPEISFVDAVSETGTIVVKRTGQDDQSYMELNVRSWPGRPPPGGEGVSTLAPAAVFVGPANPSVAGNARGDGAVDLGSFRNDAADVASGDYSSIGGGHSNRASASQSTVSGGSQNQATAEGTAIGGGYNNEARGYSNVIAGGSTNETEDDFATIGGGEYNQITFGTYGNPEYSTIAGGHYNYISAEKSFIGGGELNYIYGGYNGGESNVIVGGEWNQIAYSLGLVPSYNSIGGGAYNGIYNGVERGTIAGGFANNLYNTGTIGGGSENEIMSVAGNSTIPGGVSNMANAMGSTVLGIQGESTMYGEVAMGSNNPYARHSLLQVHREVTLT